MFKCVCLLSVLSVWLREKTGRKAGRKKGNILFNDALNTFYLWLYGVGHILKDHLDSERGKPDAATWATHIN